MAMKHELQTARLVLQPCRTENIEGVHELWTNDHVRHFLFDDRVISIDETRSFIKASLENFEQHGYGLWLVFTRDESLIGFAGFLRLAEEVPNLIYGIHPDFCGKGYATEAASAVLRYAFENLAVPLVKADVDEPNVRSVHVLEKLDMTRTGHAIIGGRALIYYQKSRSEMARTKSNSRQTANCI